ncbi:hypothetical protein [Streptomyces himalayensis]|uniref:Uncharacterized protein n=1 Tax=Streptomyces himalayensis subsp. himalayensis TaxID=2756131 RepID=A0A7W0DUE1_9ACTN|nr:hypothetical protein [Streptomyces himalayensis]MBA2951451.1 hypothetical protein [Streptomyces himalayensis subsp. himalayensis]
MLKLKPTTKAARFVYDDGAMTVSWLVSASLEGDELVDMLRRIVGFYDAQAGPPPLPQRIPGIALGMAQEAHPRMVQVTEEEGMALKASGATNVTNGWATTAGVVPPAPEIPADRQGEWELIPPGEGE